MTVLDRGGHPAGADDVEGLPARWRELASLLETWGAVGPATAMKRCSDELEQSLRQTGDALLTLAQAARESGYTSDHLGRRIRNGQLKNYGRRNAPRVRASELPKKAASLPAVSRSPHLVGATCRETARAVVSGRGH